MVTAQLYVLDKDRNNILCRGLLDTCSTTNFMSERLANRLRLKTTTCHIPVGALNSMTTYSKKMITTNIKSRINNYEKTMTFLIIPEISPLIPNQPINRTIIKMPANIRLADPEFHKPAPVDILLGAGTTLSILSIGQIKVALPKDEEFFLQKTLLGWIVGGATPTAVPATRRLCHVTTTPLFEISQFWEIEECPKDIKYTPEELQCEEHFKNHVSRKSDGRYEVALPFNDKISQMGDSYDRAYKRYIQNENRLTKMPALKIKYDEVLSEYLQLGHMTLLNEDPTDKGYYLPHHCVIKDQSMTTKVRVVFDGSAKTTTGISLNDSLFVGPTIQSNLFSLLIRFRQHPIVITGDIEKMYRQFLVRKNDHKFQRIIWNDRKYELNTVTFGLASAPYLAIRCLHQLADDEGKSYPLAAKILKEDFYVDDVLTGAQTIDEALLIRKELTEILEKAGLCIRQWASNSSIVLQNIPQDSINLHLQLGDTATLKTLGVGWNAQHDSIMYSVNPTPMKKITKRTILAETAKIFDPLGLLAPVIITAKIILQKLWSLKIDWDESLPLSIHTEWLEYYNNLRTLEDISFPRTIVQPDTNNFQLHGFSDASELAYGACIYLRTIDKDNTARVLLLCSKSRVAPLKTLTIPRLELCAAHLLAQLSCSVIAALRIKIKEIHYWTDSTIVLHWLNTPPQRLLTFAANRVADILEKTEVHQWHHVRTHENPADLVSRGKSPKEFMQSTIWKHGPPWLSDTSRSWPQFKLDNTTELPELRKITCLTTATITSSLYNTFKRAPKIEKLTRVISYCIRFIHRAKNKGPITAIEMQTNLHRIIKLVQQQEFADEIKCLKEDRPEKIRNHQLTKLNPFLDENEFIRVGGRLSHSDLPYGSKHPLILPKNNYVTKLLIEREHRTHLHPGVQQTLYAVRRLYWPIDGRSQVWKIIKECVPCCKTKPAPTQYLMGDLPHPRVSQSRPFSKVGIDYCGPFYLKEKKFRNKTAVKAYVSVFVCLAVKAVHLELVTDLTTDGFLSALRRFISRRGHCEDIFSDNGTNFVGANNVLKEIHEMFNDPKNQAKIQDYLANKNIQWHFIPPRAPHVGGLWEAAVKSFKKHLQHVAGHDQLFTYEDFNTFIIEIEAILNSRPLTPISSDPNDPLVLTPGHFLIGDSLTNLHSRNYSDTPVNRLSTWQHLQKLKQHFWLRWSREYLNELTTRTKWDKASPNLQVGAIVLLRDDQLPPAQWSMGRIINCFPGKDGIIRTVEIKTSTTTLIRT